MLSQEQETIRADLKAAIAGNEQELSKFKAMDTANVQLLRTLLEQIHALDIGQVQKRAMAGSCLRLLETAVMATRLNIELTETDAHFISCLEKKHPVLDNRELKICLLIKLDYDNQEIARTASIAARGMESARYKLHQKLGLGKNDSIKNYLTNLVVS
ncbi:MAG: hypothetical protein WCI01_10155 [Chlorobiaceae bacterium]